MLRVISYNVRRFKGADGECTAAAIGDALAPLAPALVALNEVDIRTRPEALKTLAERLGGFSVAFFGHSRGVYGNALLSRHPIVATRETHLRGGSEFLIPEGTQKFNGEVAKTEERHKILRGLLECDIELPVAEGLATRVLTVAVTHLDHMSEEQRQTQVAHALETLQAGSHPACLLGDLNALTRADYSEAEWGRLEETHAENKWALPEPSRCLEALAAAGFVDAFPASRGGGPLSEQTREDSNSIFTAHVGHPQYRIDYCFMASAASLAACGAQVHTDVVLSDHFPVSFDFSLGAVGAKL